MMLYSEKLTLFTAAHPCAETIVGGARYRYILDGNANGKPLVFLNGGMNTLEMWMDYVDALSDECQVLLFDYPQELRTNQDLVAGMRHIRNESAEEIAAAQDMFETIFKDYKQEKDVHISGLLADLMNQTPVTEADFAALAGKILLILPDQDFFSREMQADLIRLMHDPQIAYVSGGHLSTVLQTDGYIRTIRSFLHEL